MKGIYIFDMFKNIYVTEFGINSINNFLTGPYKKFGYISEHS